jgi:hypothetical protein
MMRIALVPADDKGGEEVRIVLSRRMAAQRTARFDLPRRGGSSK